MGSKSKERANRIKLECIECKHINYFENKNIRVHKERLEKNKFCKFCKKHTLHKETK